MSDRAVFLLMMFVLSLAATGEMIYSSVSDRHDKMECARLGGVVTYRRDISSEWSCVGVRADPGAAVR